LSTYKIWKLNRRNILNWKEMEMTAGVAATDIKFQ